MRSDSGEFMMIIDHDRHATYETRDVDLRESPLIYSNTQLAAEVTDSHTAKRKAKNW
jgi:hypothetical protein